MSQRQVLRQLTEAGQLQLQDFDAAGLARLLRQELITVAGQTVILTDKGRHLAAPKNQLREPASHHTRCAHRGEVTRSDGVSSQANEAITSPRNGAGDRSGNGWSVIRR